MDPKLKIMRSIVTSPISLHRTKKAFLRDRSSRFGQGVKIWAGRQDFEKYIFARRLREDFSQQFEVLRMALRAEREESSLSSWDLFDLFMFGAELTGKVVAALLLWIATETGRSAIKRISHILSSSFVGSVFQGKNAEEQLEEVIAEKKQVIDEGLARMTIVLHRELYAYAWRNQEMGPMTGMDRQAWPLPDFVREKLVK